MELSIDTASDLASVAVSRGGELMAEVTWRCRRNHTVELLPTIEMLLSQAGAEKEDLQAVFVCVGPGMYTGLRVGITIAQGLARGLDIPAVGVGRLELDAYPNASFPDDIVAVHRAGRGELAWATYRGDPWREVTPPQLSKPEDLVSKVIDRTLVVGEVNQEFAVLIHDRLGALAIIPSPDASIRRAGTLAALGASRLAAGDAGEPALLRPIYLRPPAIGPQPKPAA